MFCPRPARLRLLSVYGSLSWRDKNWEMGDKKDKDDPGAAGTGYQKKEKPPRQTGSRANGQAGKPNSTRRGPRPKSAPPGSVNQSLLGAESFLSEVLLATKARRRHSRSNLFRLTLEGDPHNGSDVESGQGYDSDICYYPGKPGDWQRGVKVRRKGNGAPGRRMSPSPEPRPLSSWPNYPGK